MGHDEKLPECKEFHCEIRGKVDKHIEESVPYRSMADKHDEQIKTLNQAYQKTLENDIDMYKRLGAIDIGMAKLEGIIQTKHDAIKLWIMAGIISGLVIVSSSLIGAILFTGGLKNQIEMDKHRVDKLEALHMK